MALCEHLTWDSEFFGRRIARLTPDRLCPEQMEHVLDWCRSLEIDCLYFLADPADGQSVATAERNGFRLVDVRVTLEARPDPQAQSDERIRPYRQSDLAALKEIAANSHRDSRFYFDPSFSEQQCNTLYQEWIARSCGGDADAVFVAESAGAPAGYVTCHRSNGEKGRIGLLGVAQNAQGKGLGTGLTGEALRWSAQDGLATVSVVTQGRNVAAQRLYQRAGFVTTKVQLWYHRWFTADS